MSNSNFNAKNWPIFASFEICCCHGIVWHNKWSLDELNDKELLWLNKHFEEFSKANYLKTTRKEKVPPKKLEHGWITMYYDLPCQTSYTNKSFRHNKTLHTLHLEHILLNILKYFIEFSTWLVLGIWLDVGDCWDTGTGTWAWVKFSAGDHCESFFKKFIFIIFLLRSMHGLTNWTRNLYC